MKAAKVLKKMAVKVSGENMTRVKVFQIVKDWPDVESFAILE